MFGAVDIRRYANAMIRLKATATKSAYDKRFSLFIGGTLITYHVQRASGYASGNKPSC
jgi:hypothetical protein